MASRNASLKATNLGVRVRLVIPKLEMPVFDLIDNQSTGLIIREALRSAGRPGATILKQILKSDLSYSDQSTGATERAVTVKYGRSKTNPRVFYLLIGIDTRHFEVHTVKSEGQITRLRKGKTQRGMGLFGVQGKLTKKGTIKSKQVFSRYRSVSRMNNLQGRPLKRFPRKYFHLIDQGFKHYMAGTVSGYKFLERLKAAIQDSMQKVFLARIKELLPIAIKKELIRKYEGVLK